MKIYFSPLFKEIVEDNLVDCKDTFVNDFLCLKMEFRVGGRRGQGKPIINVVVMEELQEL